MDQLIETGISTSLRMAAEHDELSVEDAMLACYEGLMANRRIVGDEFLLHSLAMNVAGLAVRMRRSQTMPDLYGGGPWLTSCGGSAVTSPATSTSASSWSA